MEEFAVAIALLLIAAAIFQMSRDWLRLEGILSLFSVFFLFEFVDILVPAIVTLITGIKPPQPPWIDDFSQDAIARALLFAVTAMTLFWLSYILGSRLVFTRKPPRLGSAANVAGQLSVMRLLMVLGVCYFVFLLNQVQLIQEFGGLQTYLDTFIKLRRTLELANRTFIETLILTGSMSARDLILMLTAVLFATRRKGDHWIWIVLLLGLMVSLSTFYRGTIFVYLLMLAAGEQQRLQKLYSDTKRANGGFLASARAAARARNALVQRPAFLVSLAFVGLTAVGAVRTFLAGPLWGATVTARESLRAELDRLIEGPGLYGLMAIMEHFPRDQDFMGGLTIFHQLARWVPRAIWTSKPQAYGASEIHSALGYPESTLSAITIPGEFYANFGLVGVVLMLVVGFFFGRLNFYRHDAVWQYFYATAGMSLVISVGWFSVTGFMSWLAPALMLAVILKLCFVPARSRRPRAMEISTDAPGNMLVQQGRGHSSVPIGGVAGSPNLRS